jgi:hypothetical protein
MEKFNIWMSGLSGSGMNATASFCGEFKGKNFADACLNWAKAKEKLDSFNQKRLTYWGCGLYDNEVDARKSFG